jgi:hypothetical protein
MDLRLVLHALHFVAREPARHENSNEDGRLPLSWDCRLKRLVAGVSGYICDECVTGALRF